MRTYIAQYWNSPPAGISQLLSNDARELAAILCLAGEVDGCELGCGEDGAGVSID
ncbi:hypothetical protein PIB30_012802 [Stylosanthes scabra]|uniref:Uncharacterized protein n=1 Tax=Stylosanthes scabra TaxID=79078 RepID=A0ABU6T621_9FABA|nr:hypothetical protein [Stylosanthes scabra]